MTVGFDPYASSGAAPAHTVRHVTGRLALVGLVLGLAAFAWLWTDARMRGMDMGPGTDLGALGFYVGSWVLMMAAMMLPSAAPMVLAHHRITGRRSVGKGPLAATSTLFVGGYLLTWAAFGLAAYILDGAIRSLSIEALSWERGGRYLAAGVVVAAAVYQLTPLKDVCLSTCRGPLEFILGHWRDGFFGAVRMGVEHGAFCVGCCWALMTALFAVGVMNVGWMLFVAALVAGEKLLPWKRAVNGGIATLLLTLGLALAFAPEHVPGLTLPSTDMHMPAPAMP